MSDKCPYTYFSNLIVGETTCDGKKKMYELLSELKPVYVLHLPQGREEYALDMWTSELHRFIAFLEQRFLVTITDEALRAAARQRNAERQARMELMAVQKRLPPPAFGQQLYKALDGAGFVFAAEARIQQLDDLRQSLLTAYERGERPVSPSAKRIMATGCPIGGVLDKIVGAVERLGGAVVCYENCASIKASRRLVDAADTYHLWVFEKGFKMPFGIHPRDEKPMVVNRGSTRVRAVDGQGQEYSIKELLERNGAADMPKRAYADLRSLTMATCFVILHI